MVPVTVTTRVLIPENIVIIKRHGHLAAPGIGWQRKLP